jgi:hypothetical protein
MERTTSRTKKVTIDKQEQQKSISINYNKEFATQDCYMLGSIEQVADSQLNS